MPRSAREKPRVDPTPIFEAFRGAYATELLVAGAAHFRVFERLAGTPMTFEALRRALELSERPAVVLITALRAMGLIVPAGDALTLSPLAREHLLPGGAFNVGDYLGLAAQSPGVLEMVRRLRTNTPAGTEELTATTPAPQPASPNSPGAAFIYRAGMDSAMEKEADARRLTLALAGRAKNVAPYLAGAVDLSDAGVLLDIGGGTGIYSIAFLQSFPRLRAVVWDRPEVLKVAAEFAQEYGVADRLECRPGDMFADAVPPADVMLVSNVLHDWDVPECRAILGRLAAALPTGGRVIIHDVFLNDALDGPLPVALYSAALFTITEGRAYSAAEYRTWLAEFGLRCEGPTPTLIHCGALVGCK